MLRLLTLLISVSLLGGCASAISNRMAEGLSSAIVNQDDPQTVADGVPTLLILIDGMLESDPENVDLLMAGAKMYSAYGSTFVDEPRRALRMTQRALDYAQRALCLSEEQLCGNPRFSDFQAIIDSEFDQDDLSLIYGYGSTLASWIQRRTSDWQALAEVPKIEAAMTFVTRYNERYENGRAHLYLGVVNSQLPPALGGKPEVGRQHFERAIAISEGKDLIAKVEFAASYARMMFDKALHDSLLNQVLESDINYPGLTLSNSLARRKAEKLMATSKAYFGEDE